MRLHTRITAIAFTAVAALGTSAYALGGATTSDVNVVDVSDSTLLPAQETELAPGASSSYSDRDCPEKDGPGSSGRTSDSAADTPPAAPDQVGTDTVGRQL
jgi:hypothetical protein